MKFVQDRPYAKPAAAAQRLIEIANKAAEQNTEGRIYCGPVNYVFIREGGAPDEYRAGITLLRSEGTIEMHESGTFFRITNKDREGTPLETRH